MFGAIKGIGLDYSKELNSRRIKIYDVAEKKLIKECETMTEASKFTGLSTSMISACLKTKYRSHKNKLNKTICFRG